LVQSRSHFGSSLASPCIRCGVPFFLFFASGPMHSVPVTMRTISLLLGLAVVGAEKDAEGCSVAEAQAKQLEADTTALREELSSAQAMIKRLENDLDAARSSRNSVEPQTCVADPQDVSIVGAVARTGSIAGHVVQHFLDQTEVDEKIVGAVSGGVGAAQDLTSGAVDYISSVDYSAHMNNLAKHELYVSHVAPMMGKMTQGTQPYVDQYVNPAIETATSYTNPAIQTARETYSSTMKPTVVLWWNKVLDHISIIPEYIGVLESKVANLLTPLFDFVKKAAPKHENFLPKSTLDRIIYLLISVVMFYWCLRTARFALRVALKIVRTSTWITWKVAIVSPLSFALKVVNFNLWIMTGFYCCGLCRRRKPASEDSRKAKPVQKNGNEKLAQKAPTSGDAKKAAPLQKATVDEITQLLELSKAKGKLDAAVKLLNGLATNGKPMEGKSYPNNVHGKQVDQETVNKALKKLKVDTNKPAK